MAQPRRGPRLLHLAVAPPRLRSPSPGFEGGGSQLRWVRAESLPFPCPVAPRRAPGPGRDPPKALPPWAEAALKRASKKTFAIAQRVTSPVTNRKDFSELRLQKSPHLRRDSDDSKSPWPKHILVVSSHRSVAIRDLPAHRFSSISTASFKSVISCSRWALRSA